MKRFLLILLLLVLFCFTASAQKKSYTALRVISGPTLPLTCVAGPMVVDVFIRTGATLPGLYFCSSANTWSGPLVFSLTAGAGTASSFSITGTGGGGYLEIANQVSAPSAGSSAGRLYFDSANRFSWKGANGFSRTLDESGLTADRIYTLPDIAGTIFTSGATNQQTTGLFQFAGATSAFPALARSTVNTTSLAARLADNSTYAAIDMSGFRLYSGTTNRVVDFGAFSTNLLMVNGTGIQWDANATAITGTADTALSRLSAGILQVGTSANNGLGTLTAAAYQVNGIAQIFRVTGDFTIAGNTSLQAITGLSWTVPASTAMNIPFSCHLAYSQATAAVAVAFGIQDVTVAPTSLFATGHIQTNATVFTEQNLPALTTTTATTIVTGTPSAITTIWSVDLNGMIEQPSNASTSAINIMVSTANASDLVTVKRGSFCRIN